MITFYPNAGGTPHAATFATAKIIEIYLVLTIIKYILKEIREQICVCIITS